MTIFVDLDNTLCDYNEAALDWCNSNLVGHGGPRKLLCDLTQYEIPKDFGVRGDYEIKAVDQKMWGTEGFWLHMEPIKGALAVVRKLAKTHDVWIKTVVQPNYNCVHEKHEWVLMHLRDLADRIVLLLDHTTQVLSGDVLIDDDYRALASFQGKRVMLRQYYNVAQAEMFGYYMNDWKEIGEFFDGIV